MADEVRQVSLSRINPSTIAPNDVPRFSVNLSERTHQQQQLAAKARELGDRQAWQGALAIHGEKVISRVQDHTMDTYEAAVDHNQAAVKRAESSGDRYRASLVKEFAHLLTEETATNLLNINRGAARDIAATTHDMASFPIPPRPKGFLERLLS